MEPEQPHPASCIHALTAAARTITILIAAGTRNLTAAGTRSVTILTAAILIDILLPLFGSLPMLPRPHPYLCLEARCFDSHLETAVAMFVIAGDIDGAGTGRVDEVRTSATTRTIDIERTQGVETSIAIWWARHAWLLMNDG